MSPSRKVTGLLALSLSLALAALRQHQPGRFRWSGKITVVE